MNKKKSNQKMPERKIKTEENEKKAYSKINGSKIRKMRTDFGGNEAK